jgi:hypothetical protein
VKREVDPGEHLAVWHRANRLTGNDPASLYLRQRGFDGGEWPASLRWQARTRYYRGDAKSWTEHPAMLALFVARLWIGAKRPAGSVPAIEARA